MSFQQKDGSGVLFKNDKGDNYKRPDYKGEICINGALYELAAWVKEGKKGKFMSVSIGKEKQPKQPAEKRGEDFDDSIPF